MTCPIGFVLLVNPYNKLEQSDRLIRKLNALFDHPPIAVHHDFGKNPKFLPDLPENVRLVHPHVDTKWADFSCIEAAIKALRLLYSGSQRPDWFIYLSGSDYPVKPAAKILADLQASPFDAHIQHLPLGLQDDLGWWLRGSFERFCSVKVTVPWVTRHLSLTTRDFWLHHPFFTRGRLPYSDHLKPYCGEAWFCGNYRAAQAILDFYDTDRALANHCRQILVPEETYFHTVLGNAPQLKLSQDYLRYVDWTNDTSPHRPLRLDQLPDARACIGSSPRILTMADLPLILNSTAHFARKFDDKVDPAILDELDRLTSN
jgi:hypothetical protein